MFQLTKCLTDSQMNVALLILYFLVSMLMPSVYGVVCAADANRQQTQSDQKSQNLGFRYVVLRL